MNYVFPIIITNLKLWLFKWTFSETIKIWVTNFEICKIWFQMLQLF